jgi:uncharacterized protein involved in tellurium resistance
MSRENFKIDAALNTGDGKAYFFIGDKVVRYDITSDKTDKGYPIPIEVEWAGLYPADINASVLWANEKAYFFKDDAYMRSTIKTKRVTENFVRPIADGWKKLPWKENIDAVIAFNEEVAYWFKSNLCQKTTFKGQVKCIDEPKKISEYFPGVWEDGIDAVINWGNGCIYFFKGNQYMRFSIEKNAVDLNFPKEISSATWPGLIKSFKSQAKILKNPGESTTISVPDNVTIKLSWFKDIDFDLAVLYKSTDGRKGIIYFGNKGTLDAFPFIKLDKDEMYDGEKLKEETIEIKKLDEMEELFIICWDFSNKGGSSAFSDSNVNVSIVDSNGNSTTAILRSESGFDSACVAKISNKKGIYNFSNLSKSFKRDMNPQNLYEILK